MLTLPRCPLIARRRVTELSPHLMPWRAHVTCQPPMATFPRPAPVRAPARPLRNPAMLYTTDRTGPLQCIVTRYSDHIRGHQGEALHVRRPHLMMMIIIMRPGDKHAFWVVARVWAGIGLGCVSYKDHYALLLTLEFYS